MSHSKNLLALLIYLFLSFVSHLRQSPRDAISHQDNVFPFTQTVERSQFKSLTFACWQLVDWSLSVSVARSQDQLTIVLASIFAIILLLIIVAAVTFTIGKSRSSTHRCFLAHVRPRTLYTVWVSLHTIVILTLRELVLCYSTYSFCL